MSEDCKLFCVIEAVTEELADADHYCAAISGEGQQGSYYARKRKDRADEFDSYEAAVAYAESMAEIGGDWYVCEHAGKKH